MTSTTQSIFDAHEIRKTRRQKEAFRNYIIPKLREMGYSVTVEKGRFGSRNILIGDVDKAKVLYTAHYDTCAVLPVPNFITPKNPGIYILYQLLLVLLMFLVIGLCCLLAGFVSLELVQPVYFLSLIGMMVLLVAGPANKHTANDNTSGVTAILDLAQEMPEELRGKAAFVLFDLEEAGLLGSASFASKHPGIRKKTPVINLDCVSDGKTAFFAVPKRASGYTSRLRQAFAADGELEPLFSEKHHIYPSDQMNFQYGIGVATLNSTRSGLLYMNRIHTRRDVIYREENIRYMVRGCIQLTRLM